MNFYCSRMLDDDFPAIFSDQHLFELTRRRAEDSLLAGGPRRREAEELLHILTDRHGAEDVEKDEGAFGEVVAGEVAVRQSLNPGDRCEGQACDDAAVKDGVEHRQQRSEGEAGEEPKIEQLTRPALPRAIGQLTSTSS